jgi:hypothetical protein
VPLIKTILASRPGVPMLVIEDIADGGGACPPSPNAALEYPKNSMNRSIIAVIPEISKSQEEFPSESQQESSSDLNNSVKPLLL